MPAAEPVKAEPEHVSGPLETDGQVELLLDQHRVVHNKDNEIIALIREDRDKSLAQRSDERDAWKSAATDATQVAQEVRAHNGKSIALF